MQKELTIDQVRDFRNTLLQFNGIQAGKKSSFLNFLSSLPIKKSTVLIAWHDCMLLALAYPQSKEIFIAAEAELERVAKIIADIHSGKNEAKKLALNGSGIVYTELNASFSFTIVKWLIEKLGKDVTLFTCDAKPDELQRVMRLLLSKVEIDSCEKQPQTLKQWIKRAGGNPTQSLHELVSLFDHSWFPDEVKDHLFESLKVFVNWKLSADAPSRTSARSLPSEIFLHKKPLVKSFNVRKILGKKIKKARNFSMPQEEMILDTARGMLATLQRETDPVTYCSPAELERHSMNRGIDIVLFPMLPSRRLLLESYIGYVAFKNRIPVAYGGGWVFIHRSKIGINVLPQFRGGESSYLFAQILRLYHQRFNVQKFIVEPYQYGWKNAEGLKSGAFWFYYRLGFRPEENDLKKLAEAEFQKIQSNHKYRTPLSTLKRFTKCNLQLVLKKVVDCNPDITSRKVSALIAGKYKGNRLDAASKSAKTIISDWSKTNYRTFHIDDTLSSHEMAPLIDLIDDYKKWNRKDRLNLMKLFKDKCQGMEVDYLMRLQKHKRFINALIEIEQRD